MISELEYDLEDSDNEGVKVSRSVKLPRRPHTLKIVPVTFIEKEED